MLAMVSPAGEQTPHMLVTKPTIWSSNVEGIYFCSFSAQITTIPSHCPPSSLPTEPRTYRTPPAGMRLLTFDLFIPPVKILFINSLINPFVSLLGREHACYSRAPSGDRSTATVPVPTGRLGGRGTCGCVSGGMTIEEACQ